MPWCWTSSVHSISCLEVRTHASTRADRFASEAEARGSLGADLWITRSVGAVMLKGAWSSVRWSQIESESLTALP